jgi:hypothetical protein
MAVAHFLTAFDSPVTITYHLYKSEQAVNEFVQSIPPIFFGHRASTVLAWVFHSIRINGEDGGDATEQSRSSVDLRD